MKGSFVSACVMALVSMMAAPADAANVDVYSDQTGDAQGGRDPRADITQVSAAYGDGQMSVAVGTQGNESPSSASWADGRTIIAWELVTSNQTTFVAHYKVSGGRLSGAIYDQSGNSVCEAAATFYPQVPDPYILSFASTCLGSPSSFAALVIMDYFAAENGAESADRAPDSGYCCEVSPA